MNETGESVHVTFGRSRAGSVCEALRMQGCNARVVGLPDDLSFGPIDPPDTVLRQSWMKSVLRHDPDGDWGPCDPSGRQDASDVDRAWAEATAPGVHPVYWVCMTDPAEQAAFLAFASRMEARPFDIIDVTGLTFTTAAGIERPYWSLGMMPPGEIVACGAHKRRRSVSPAEIGAASRLWSRLRQENAPFRIVRDGKLTSAPLTYFDAFLIGQATAEWEVAARLIGRTMASLSDDMDPPGQSPSDLVLFGRLLALGEAGLLDIEGPGPGMRAHNVRKPQARG